MESCRLSDRAVISLSGPEARDFLQNLITNDVGKLEPGRGLYAALLSPQGKIGFDFFLVEGQGALLLDVAAKRRERRSVGVIGSVSDSGMGSVVPSPQTRRKGREAA